MGLVIALSGRTCWAQGISGVVYDPSGGIVAGARVMLMQDYVKFEETQSSRRGEFSFAGLKPGRYQLQIKQPRFSLFQMTVNLDGSGPARIDAVLAPARVMEEVGVRATLPPGARKTIGKEHEVREGGYMEPPQPLTPPRPAYPEGAVSRGVDGTVVLFATIKTDGSVDNIVVMESPDAELQEEAIRAFKKCRYQPARLNGQVVEDQITIAFNFQLQ